MKTTLNVLLVAISFFPASAFAASPNGNEMKDVLGSYLKIQEELHGRIENHSLSRQKPQFTELKGISFPPSSKHARS